MAASAGLSVASTHEGIRRAATAFDTFGAEHGLPPDVQWRVAVALDEVLSNTVLHGHCREEDWIAVEFSVSDGAVVVRISDSALTFNPLGVAPPDTDSPLASRPVGGLGIALVRALMDTVEYGTRDGRNQIVLTKRLERTAAGD